MHTPDPSRVGADMYKAWEKAMGDWWDTVLESPEFLKSMGEGFAQNAKARDSYQKQMDRNLEAMHLPTRGDMVRIARICSLLEDRLLQMEDRLLAMEDRMVNLEKETLKARVDAAEARLVAEDRLAGIEARLDQLLAGQAPAKGPRSKA